METKYLLSARNSLPSHEQQAAFGQEQDDKNNEIQLKIAVKLSETNSSIGYREISYLARR
jgi:hypothetical protein